MNAQLFKKVYSLLCIPVMVPQVTGSDPPVGVVTVRKSPEVAQLPAEAAPVVGGWAMTRLSKSSLGVETLYAAVDITFIYKAKLDFTMESQENTYH